MSKTFQAMIEGYKIFEVTFPKISLLLYRLVEVKEASLLTQEPLEHMLSSNDLLHSWLSSLAYSKGWDAVALEVHEGAVNKILHVERVPCAPYPVLPIPYFSKLRRVHLLHDVGEDGGMEVVIKLAGGESAEVLDLSNNELFAYMSPVKLDSSVKALLIELDYGILFLPSYNLSRSTICKPQRKKAKSGKKRAKRGKGSQR